VPAKRDAWPPSGSRRRHRLNDAGVTGPKLPTSSITLSHHQGHHRRVGGLDTGRLGRATWAPCAVDDRATLMSWGYQLQDRRTARRERERALPALWFLPRVIGAPLIEPFASLASARLWA